MDNFTPCPRCGTLCDPSLGRCSICHAELVAAPSSAPAAAAELDLDLGSIPSATRKVVAAGVVAFCPRCRRPIPEEGGPCLHCERVAAELAAAPRPGVRLPWGTIVGVVLVLGLIGGGLLFARYQEERKKPKISFAAPAPAAPVAAPAAQSPHASSAATRPAPRQFFESELAFGGRRVDWWKGELETLRSASDPALKGLYPLAKVRAERAGLVVEERGPTLEVRPSEQVLQQLHKRGEQ